MRLQKPTKEEKRALKGETNVAALLNALDLRLSEKTPLIIVGRASYQIGDDDFGPKLRQLLGEEHKIDEETGKLFVTEDIDCFHTDEAQAVIDAAHEHSYLAEMAKCYVHALNEQTLVLPIGWKSRLQGVACKLEHLQLMRLDPLDFIICKGAAGRPKDTKFLQALCQALKIGERQVREKVEETLKHKPTKLVLDTSAQRFLAMLPGRLFPPTPEA
ncbi:hypothetical protein SBV1_760003 [Verrucomicrobia bacterium]|nr:hypothetical protein SBV1_760003 [Verrucomicrobiota bacterium]